VDTLPDYLRAELHIVFVGINPGAYSAQVGHYFATPQNRFWSALNRSGLAGAGEDLGPADDARMNDYGIGFTDVVKRASNSASSLRVGDYRRWAPVLQEKLLRYRPLVICFNGVTGYRNYLRYAEGIQVAPELGPQEHHIGTSHVFVVPSSSPANAAYSLAVLAEWYKRLGEYRDQVKQGQR
jgi:TDG/mug DNA glycosylase family protein